MSDLINGREMLNRYQIDLCDGIACKDCSMSTEDGGCKVEEWIDKFPSADRPSEVIYGNEHNCIMTIFGECSYAETGCGDCAVVEKVRKALSADRSQEWIPCSERLPKENTEVLMSLEWGIDIGECRNGDWHSEWINHYDDGNVLAWMPLPKPWKGADDETD